MAQFDDLPDELQLKIFEIAARRDCQPRIVEICFKSGDIYSRTLPPPLLHVCKLSRWVILKKYKPWLPQFKDKPWYAPYKHLVQEYGMEKFSRLNNVCIDLEHDMLLIDKQQWSKWEFGYLEERNLRNLSVNLNGWIHWKTSVDLLQQFRKLRRASIYDNGGDGSLAQFKADEIRSLILQAERTRSERGSDFTAPIIDTLFMPDAIAWDGASEDWYTYKYPRGYKSRRSQARLELSSDLDRFAGIFGSWASTASGRNKRIQPERRLTRLDDNMGGSISRLTITTSTPPPTPFADNSNPRGAPNQAQQRGSAAKVAIPTLFFSTPTWNNSNGQNGAIQRPAEDSPLRSSASTNILPCARFGDTSNALNVQEGRRREGGVRNANIETGNFPPTFVSETSDCQQITKQKRYERNISKGRVSESAPLTTRKATGILSPATVPKNLNSQHNLKRKRQIDRGFESSIFGSRKESRDENKAKSIAPSKTALCKDSTYNSISHTTIKHKKVEDSDAAASSLAPRKVAMTTSYRMAQPSIEFEESDKFSRQLAMPDFEDWDDSDSVSSYLSSRAFTESADYLGPEVDHTMEDAQMKETDLKSSWETLAEESFAEIFEDIGFLRTPSPELNSEPLISSPLDLNSSLSPSTPPSAFENFEISYLVESVFSPNENVPCSPSFVDPRAAFYNPFDQPESTEIASMEKMVQEHQALGISGSMNGPELSEEGSLKEVVLERKVPPRQYPQVIIYQKNNIASTMGKSEFVPTPVISFPVPVVVAPAKERQGSGPDPECLTLARLVSGEPQYLVQWKDQSEESWVSEKSLLRSAPELVREWKSRQVEVHDKSKVAPPVLEYIVERILGKKKIKGVSHYLVKWEGYPLEKDRTWEPCDRLRIDVPTLVDEYESTDRRKRRRKL